MAYRVLSSWRSKGPQTLRWRTTFTFLSNPARTVLYVGVTNNLERRVSEHKAGAGEGFTKRYFVRDLMYFEETDDVMSAIEREKQLKLLTRARKARIVETMNPSWRDLSADF